MSNKVEFLSWKICESRKLFVHYALIHDYSALVQEMAWRRSDPLDARPMPDILQFVTNWADSD